MNTYTELGAERFGAPPAIQHMIRTDAAPGHLSGLSSHISEDLRDALRATTLALKASYAINRTGQVLFSALPRETSADFVGDHQLIVRDGCLTSDQPVLADALRRSLARSNVTEFQCIGPPEIDSVITLRSVLIHSETFVFVRLPANNVPSQVEILNFGKLFSLTAAESQVLLMLCTALSPEEIAARHSVAISTVRSHIRNILIKTSCSEVRGLVIRVCRLTS